MASEVGMLTVGMLAFLGAFIFYKLDKITDLQAETNMLLKEGLGKKPQPTPQKSEEAETPATP